MRLVLSTPVLFAVLTATSSSLGQVSSLADAPSGPARPGLVWNGSAQDEGVDQEEPARKHGVQRPFAYAMDPSTPFAGELGLEYLIQGASGVKATRPLPANLSAQGFVHGATMSVGITDWIAPYASVLAYQPMDVEGASGEVTGQGGLMFQLTDPSAAFRVGAQAGFLREFAGEVGASGRLTATYDVGRLRMVGNAHFEKVFADDRDNVDVLAFAGASIRTTEILRVGAEYVGQDLEDVIENEEAEGGARHFAALVASMELAEGSFWITGGPAFGLNDRSPDLMGRLSLLALF